MLTQHLRATGANVVHDDPFLALKKAGHGRIYQAGENLYQQADPCTGVFWVESGLVGFRKVDEDGTSMLVNVARRGDLVGYGPLLSDEEHMTGAEVLKPGRMYFIDEKTMRRLIRDVPGLLAVLLRQATHDLGALEDKYLQMATRQAHMRLASLLLSFSREESAQSKPGSCSFQLPIMNKDIADLIGIRPETLSRAIGQLRSSGLADLHGRTVHIPNMTKLARICGGASQLMVTDYAA